MLTRIKIKFLFLNNSNYPISRKNNFYSFQKKIFHSSQNCVFLQWKTIETLNQRFFSTPSTNKTDNNEVNRRRKVKRIWEVDTKDMISKVSAIPERGPFHLFKSPKKLYSFLLGTAACGMYALSIYKGISIHPLAISGTFKNI